MNSACREHLRFWPSATMGQPSGLAQDLLGVDVARRVSEPLGTVSIVATGAAAVMAGLTAICPLPCGPITGTAAAVFEADLINMVPDGFDREVGLEEPGGLGDEDLGDPSSTDAEDFAVHREGLVREDGRPVGPQGAPEEPGGWHTRPQT